METNLGTLLNNLIGKATWLHESESLAAHALVGAIDEEMSDIFEKFNIEPVDATPPEVVPPSVGESAAEAAAKADTPVAATRPAAPLGSPDVATTLPPPAPDAVIPPIPPQSQPDPQALIDAGWTPPAAP